MSKRLVFGCVADNKHPFLFQALRLVLSIRWFGGAYAQADIIVCCVEHVDPGYRDLLARWGVSIRIVPRISSGNPMANKIQFFLLPELKAYDTAVYLDCDILVVDDLSEYIDYPEFQAKIADLPTVPNDTLAMLCKHFGLVAPEAIYKTTFLQVATIWYCNAGFLILPTQWIDPLVSRWIYYEALLGRDPSLLGPAYHHRSQAGLALAWIETAIPFRELPVGMNFPLHLTEHEASAEILTAKPIIIHYHQNVDREGYLLPSPYPLVQEKINLFNQRLHTEIETLTNDHDTIPSIVAIEHPQRVDIPELVAVRDLYIDMPHEASIADKPALAQLDNFFQKPNPRLPMASNYAATFRILQLEMQLIDEQRASHMAAAECASYKTILEARDKELSTVYTILTAREVEIAAYARELASVWELVSAREAETTAMRTLLTAREVEIAAYTQELASVKALVAAREAEIAAYTQELASVKALVVAREAEIAAYAQELAAMQARAHD